MVGKTRVPRENQVFETQTEKLSDFRSRILTEEMRGTVIYANFRPLGHQSLRVIEQKCTNNSKYDKFDILPSPMLKK